MAENIKLDLDPKKVLQSINDLSDGFKRLSQDIEDSIGKEAPKSIDKAEKAAEQGSNKILTTFKNMGKQLKEDLKTAFDVGSVVGGLKMAKEIGEGIRQVFDLEKAFDKLNTRLGLTGQQFAMFKKNVGSAVSATGQKMEDVFPGIETAAAKGGIKSPEELASIGKSLAEVRAATGESTDALSDAVVEILRTQGKKVTAQTFASTLDALQATRVQGAFKTAGEAGAAIEQISPYAKQMGLGTRDMGALAAVASKSGAAGQDILRQLMEQASQPGGKEKLNAVFGTQLFKNGKLDASQIGNINTSRFGKFSQQSMESATGISGAAGSDLTRFVESFKDNMGDFKKVVDGTNETANQFGTATDNLASSLDKFKQNTINSTRTIGDDLSTAAHDLLKGNIKGAGGDLLGAGKAAWENKGTLAGAVGVTAAAGLLMGGGMNSLLKKIPGGKMLGGLAGGAAAEAMGVQKVYVVNAGEMGGGGGAMDKLSQFGGIGGKLGAVAGVGGALAGGVEIGNMINQIPGVQENLGKVTDMIFAALNPSDEEIMAKGAKMVQKPVGGNAAGQGQEDIAAAVARGTEQGHVRANKNKPVQLTNPSSVNGRGGAY